MALRSLHVVRGGSSRVAAGEFQGAVPKHGMAAALASPHSPSNTCTSASCSACSHGADWKSGSRPAQPPPPPPPPPLPIVPAELTAGRAPLPRRPAGPGRLRCDLCGWQGGGLSGQIQAGGRAAAHRRQQAATAAGSSALLGPPRPARACEVLLGCGCCGARARARPLAPAAGPPQKSLGAAMPAAALERTLGPEWQRCDGSGAPRRSGLLPSAGARCRPTAAAVSLAFGPGATSFNPSSRLPALTPVPCHSRHWSYKGPTHPAWRRRQRGAVGRFARFGQQQVGEARRTNIER